MVSYPSTGYTAYVDINEISIHSFNVDKTLFCSNLSFFIMQYLYLFFIVNFIRR